MIQNKYYVRVTKWKGGKIESDSDREKQTEAWTEAIGLNIAGIETKHNELLLWFNNKESALKICNSWFTLDGKSHHHAV
jgi:hypothetical protein